MELDHDLLRTALLGALIGGGGYGALRLAHDIPKAATPPSRPANELDIPIPKSFINKTSDWKSEMLYPIMAGVGGAGVGFAGTSAIYEHLKRKAAEKDLANQEQTYMQTLQKVHNKLGSELPETPLTDKFLEGMLEKVAYGIADQIHGSGFGGTVKHIFDWGADTDAGKKLLTAAAILTLGTGAATYGIANSMDSQKEKAKRDATFPDTVNLKPI